MFVFDTGIIGPRRLIINFPTKMHWRGSSKLDDIRSGLDSLVDIVAERGITSLAIPALGCGNGGLAWPDVLPLIEAACQRMPAVRAVVFAPEGAPSPAAMPNLTRRPNLTIMKATLILAIGRYLSRARLQEVRDGVSELEIQKLAYLLQLLGAPLKLTFERGRYGPYSQDLSHVLDNLEGHYLTGLGDRSKRVTELVPVNAMPEATDAAQRLLADDHEGLARIDSMLNLSMGSKRLIAWNSWRPFTSPPFKSRERAI